MRSHCVFKKSSGNGGGMEGEKDWRRFLSSRKVTKAEERKKKN